MISTLRIVTFCSLATLSFCQDDKSLWPQDAASANQGPGRYNSTLEIIFDMKQIFNVEEYTFNISLGTPFQNFPVTLDTTVSDVLIGNSTLQERETVEFYGYNPANSSSARQDFEILTYNNTDIETDPEMASVMSDILSYRVFYSQDNNFSIGGVSFATPLTFRSYEDAVTAEDTTKHQQVFYNSHRVGFGLPGASFANINKTDGNPDARMYAGVIDDLRYGAGVIRSYTYSIWLDTPQDRTGHFLLGGLDESAFTGPLVNLNTTVMHSNNGIYSIPVLTVDTAFTSITPAGQNELLFDLKVGATVLAPGSNLFLPGPSAEMLWALLGANVTTNAYGAYMQSRNDTNDLDRLLFSVPEVPCSYLQNTTTLDFKFTGSNTTVKIPMSDLTKGDRDSINRREICVLTIRPLMGQQDIAYFGHSLLKSLYTVYDLENKVISVAATKGAASASRTIKPIPEEGVAAMSLQANANTTATKPSAAATLSGWSGVASGLVALSILVTML